MFCMEARQAGEKERGQRQWEKMAQTMYAHMNK
jgi:hypothetical protein